MTPAVMYSYTLGWNPIMRVWRAVIHDEANTVIYAESREKLLEMMDSIQERTKHDAGCHTETT
jgi:hypothetical protein